MKIWGVRPLSTRYPPRSSPMLKNAVESETRDACCMLCVTMTMVYSVRSSRINSSILSVAIGSRAEQGSSIKITSGRTAMARAMQRRCCWPPESEVPGSLSLSFTSFQSAAFFSDSSTIPAISALLEAPARRSPLATLPKIDIVGNGFGFWKTMPITRRTRTGSTRGP